MESSAQEGALPPLRLSGLPMRKEGLEPNMGLGGRVLGAGRAIGDEAALPCLDPLPRPCVRSAKDCSLMVICVEWRTRTHSQSPYLADTHALGPSRPRPQKDELLVLDADPSQRLDILVELQLRRKRG